MECPAWEHLRQRALSVNTRAWVAQLTDEGKQNIADIFIPQSWNNMPLPLHGDEVRWTGTPCWLTGHIFMDGAAFNPKSASHRRAGWSLCQVGPTGELVAGVFGYLPSQVSWEQQVRDSEDYCVAMLGRYARGKVHAYTDCEGTFLKAQRGQLTRAQGAKQIREHIWSRLGTWEHLEVTWHKVKAHLSEAAVQHDEYLKWCRIGNEHADCWAKAGAAWHLERTQKQWQEVQLVNES
eukprot:4609959-Amphidinium_carterae.1